MQIWDADNFDSRKPPEKVPSPIYYISLLGLDSVVSELFYEKPSAGLSSRRVFDLVNAQGGCHGNALQAASVRGHERTVQLLLEIGADVNAQDNSRFGTALQAASARGHETTVQLLLENGADISAEGSGDHAKNALVAASEGGHEKIVLLLLEKGADINAQSNGCCFQSALQAASAGGHEKTVQLLLEKEADINMIGLHGRTALSLAAGKANVAVVKLL